MAPASHYFDERPSAGSSPRDVDLVLPDVSLRLRTDRGVFGAAGVDPGTRLLLLEAPHPSAAVANILDLGCGYGPIALTLARRAPHASVWAVDVNERARALCTANAITARLENVTVAAPADVPDDVLFDGIWSNPPIRIGKDALHELLQQWLPRLAEDGRAWLVVQKHLGSDSLARWLDESGYPTERLCSRAGYRVLEVAAA